MNKSPFQIRMNEANILLKYKQEKYKSSGLAAEKTQIRNWIQLKWNWLTDCECCVCDVWPLFCHGFYVCSTFFFLYFWLFHLTCLSILSCAHRVSFFSLDFISNWLTLVTIDRLVKLIYKQPRKKKQPMTNSLWWSCLGQSCAGRISKEKKNKNRMEIFFLI